MQSNTKILIAEDNKINMLLIKTMIKHLFPEATLYESTDGEDAIVQFEANQPGIILMDIQMPIMDGYEATRAIRKLDSGKTVPIIALTAGSFDEEKENAVLAGMNDYISKPINKDLLWDTIIRFTR